MTLNNLGALLADLGERERAREHYEEALGIYRQCFQKSPGAFRRNLSIVLTSLRQLYDAMGLKKKAEAIGEMIEKLVEDGGGGDRNAAQ